MPIICEFFGIKIYMYWNEHYPEHFHAEERAGFKDRTASLRGAMLPTVIQVVPTKDFKVYAYFSDGKIKLFDMNPLIKMGGVFKSISNINVFINKCTVINHTVAWDLGGNFDPYRCLDVAPDTIYRSGIDVADPLTQAA